MFQTAFTPGRQAEDFFVYDASMGGEEHRVEKRHLALHTGHRHRKGLRPRYFELIERGLTKQGVPKPIIAAWLREWSQMKSTMCLNPETMSPPLF